MSAESGDRVGHGGLQAERVLNPGHCCPGEALGGTEQLVKHQAWTRSTPSPTSHSPAEGSSLYESLAA